MAAILIMRTAVHIKRFSQFPEKISLLFLQIVFFLKKLFSPIQEAKHLKHLC